MALSRADLKLKLKKYISSNARLLNTAKNVRLFLEDFIDSAYNVEDDSVGGSTSWGSIGGTLSDQTDLQSALNGKQSTLVSGTNIKTVNGNSLVGTGDVSIPQGDTLVSEGELINSATSKTTPVDTDQIGLMDSAASNVLKKLSWSNIKATLKTYFDTLYVDKTWKPVQIPIGAMLTSGATYASNTGAGIYISMSGGAADDSIFFNVHLLDGNGTPYDGSILKLRIHGRTSSNGAGGDTVGLLLNYAFVKPSDNSMTKVTNVAQQNIDVSTRLQDIEFETDLANMTGASGDEILQVTIIRNSTGPSADTYTGNFRITGIEIVKV